MEFSFTGKRALVTGGGKGIGRGLVKALHARGATVITISRTQADLDTLQGECPGIDTICLDITDWQQTNQQLEKLETIDLLVNNAAVVHAGPLIDLAEDDFDHVINTNLKAAMNVTSVLARKMITNEIRGAIVNISSVLSETYLEQASMYSISKAALDQFTRCLAVELGPHQIRVNSIQPTLVPETAMAKAALEVDPVRYGKFLERTPLGHWTTIEDVVNTTLFLLSEKAGMITGSRIPIEGGALCT